MQKIIKLIEVREEPSSYCPDVGKCKTSFSQRPLFINPDNVLFLREDTTIAVKLKDCLDSGGLVRKQGFTKLTFSSGNNNVSLTVVGTPEKVVRDMSGKNNG